MEVLFKILILIFTFYGFFILWITLGCFKIKWFRSDNIKAQNTFTIIVPFRNEKENLPILLDSISKLQYPKELFEVILVDDSSIEKLQFADFGFKVLVLENQRKSNSPKKDAINTAIQQANFEWILTTDADCEVPQRWLSVLDSFIQKNEKAKMVCGMVLTKNNNSFLSRFQLLDFMSLQSATIGTFGIGKPFMCNGANFAYKKSFFIDLHGFSGNEHIASGDDVFLLQKAIENHSGHVLYLRSKQFSVLTNPVISWKDLFIQRVRWASKTKAYKTVFAQLLALVVLLGNTGFICSIFGLFYNWNFAWFIGFKLLIDFLLLIQVRKTVPKFNKSSFLISGFVYPFFSFCVGMRILFKKKYQWKERALE